jgi:gamma-glutamylputrescine oxidase
MKYDFFWDVGYDDYAIKCVKLGEDISTKWLVVGGGLSGLFAALELFEKGEQDIVIVEGFECGRGTTGASTGFVMPDTETGYAGLVSHFGERGGTWLWNYVKEGCDIIWDTAQRLGLKTDIEEQTSLYVGVKGKEKDIEEEQEYLSKIDKELEVYDQSGLSNIVGNTGIHNAISYGGTYAMDPLLYAHELKRYLLENGVTIYEHTTIDKVEDQTAYTKDHKIFFDKAIVTVNKPKANVTKLANRVYGVQSSASVSRILTKEEITNLFPDGVRKMVYDSRDFYLYFRLTRDNRIILGQDSMSTLLLPKASKNTAPVLAAQKELSRLFNVPKDLEYEYYWSEIIDGTYDLVPLISRSGNIIYSGGNVGLPWASRTGVESARVAMGGNIPRELSVNRVPYTMLGENSYAKMAQYVLYYQLAKWNKNII